HDPRERRLREAEILADRRQGDVHDGRVEHDHEASEAEHDQCQPAPVALDAAHVSAPVMVLMWFCMEDGSLDGLRVCLGMTGQTAETHRPRTVAVTGSPGASGDDGRSGRLDLFVEDAGA